MTGAHAAAMDDGAARGGTCAGELPSWAPGRHRTSAANDFIVSNVPRVQRIARKMARRLPPHVPMDDLISAGTIGLIDAARRYDPSVCSRFEVFAEHRIRGAMLDELRAHDSLSRDLRSRWRRRDEAVAALEQSLGRSPSSEEVAEHLGIDIGEYQRMLDRVYQGQTTSAEAVTRDGSGAQSFADNALPDPCEVAMARERRDLIARAITELPERLQLVTSLYYKEGLTLAQIGKTLGVTEARACQLRGESVRRLKETLASWEVTGV